MFSRPYRLEFPHEQAGSRMTELPLGCEAARHRTIAVNGIPLHLLESGPPTAPGLCFLHGGAAHAHWFDRVTPALTDRFHVVATTSCWTRRTRSPRPSTYS
jgi:hypothetical protein